MQDILDQFFLSINKTNQWLGTPQPLPYLFISGVVKTEGVETNILRRRQKLRVENRQIVDCNDNATHEITDILATPSGRHSINIKDLITEEETILNLID